MTTLREAAQQALEALRGYRREIGCHQSCDAERGLESALAQPDRAQRMRDAGYTRRPTLREMAQEEKEDIAQNLQSRLGAALLLEARRQEIAQPRRETEQQERGDGMPASADERYLRRLLAARVGIPGMYYDDGEAHGAQHGISIDFMREPVADIDAKLRALNVARAALAQQEQEQEPVAWTLTETLDRRETTTTGYLWFSDPQNSAWTPLYTAPPRRKWQSLSEEEIDAIDKSLPRGMLLAAGKKEFARAIEAKLKEKNNE
jgi:hypothetical protein